MCQSTIAFVPKLIDKKIYKPYTLTIKSTARALKSQLAVLLLFRNAMTEEKRKRL